MEIRWPAITFTALVLTDIASGWTEAAALIVREQTLITVTLDEIQSRLPFPMLGLDVDNDSAFINETLLSYCRERKLELDEITRVQEERSGLDRAEERSGHQEVGRLRPTWRELRLRLFWLTCIKWHAYT